MNLKIQELMTILDSNIQMDKNNKKDFFLCIFDNKSEEKLNKNLKYLKTTLNFLKDEYEEYEKEIKENIYFLNFEKNNINIDSLDKSFLKIKSFPLVCFYEKGILKKALPFIFKIIK